MTEQATETSNGIKTGWGWVLASGILMAVLGILLLGMPVVSAMAASTMAGIALIISGTAAIAVGVSAARPQRRWADIVLGIVAELVGLYCLLFPLAGSVSLALAVAFWLVFRGSFELVGAVRAWTPHGRALFLVSALLDLAMGVLMLANYPFPAVQMLGIVVALSLLFAGIATIFSSIGLRDLEKL